MGRSGQAKPTWLTEGDMGIIIEGRSRTTNEGLNKEREEERMSEARY